MEEKESRKRPGKCCNCCKLRKEIADFIQVQGKQIVLNICKDCAMKNEIDWKQLEEVCKNY